MCNGALVNCTHSIILGRCRVTVENATSPQGKNFFFDSEYYHKFYIIIKYINVDQRSHITSYIKIKYVKVGAGYYSL